MPSTYSSQLRLELMANGENSNSWGTKANTTWQLVEAAIAGMATVTITGGAYSLTSNNAAADEARSAALKFTGTLTSNATITVPSTAKMYVVWNATSGAYTLTIKTSGGSGVAVAQGDKVVVWCDGTDFYVPAPSTLSPTSIELGHASDTTLTRVSAGVMAVEGKTVGTLSTAQTWSASQRGAITTDNDLSFDLSVTNNFSCTPSAGGTLTFTNPSGQSGFIKLVNGSNYAIAAAATTKISAADLSKISATGTYIISYYSDGTNTFCSASANLA